MDNKENYGLIGKCEHDNPQKYRTFGCRLLRTRSISTFFFVIILSNYFVSMFYLFLKNSRILNIGFTSFTSGLANLITAFCELIRSNIWKFYWVTFSKLWCRLFKRKFDRRSATYLRLSLTRLSEVFLEQLWLMIVFTEW